MCGIFGIINYDGKLKRYMADLDNIKQMTSSLLSVAQSRGTDASGICMVTLSGEAMIYKARKSGRELTGDLGYSKIMNAIDYQSNFRMMIGHTRAKTKGTEYNNANNHPIVACRVVGVHNGMISNDDDLFDVDESLIRKGQVDSEIIFRLIDKFVYEKHTLVASVRRTAQAIIGSYSCAFIHLDHPNYLTLFAGAYPSIAIQNFKHAHMMIFASTDDIITKATEGIYILREPTSKLEVDKNTGIRINTFNGKIYTFDTGAKVPNNANAMTCGAMGGLPPTGLGMPV